MNRLDAKAISYLPLLAACAGVGGCRETDACDPLPTHGECSPLLDHARTERCLSIDASAAGGRLPRYPDVDAPASEFGEPLFSLDRNDWSLFGKCALEPVREASAVHVACDPTWDSETIELVCGTIGCLQDDAVVEEDCVLVDGVWRAVRGSDVSTPEEWIVDEPGTRQDPELEGCTDYATSSEGVVDPGKLLDCVHQLGAADRRGFCIDSVTQPPPPDVCADKN